MPINKTSTSVQSNSFPTEPFLLDIRGVAHVLSSSIWTVRALLWNDEIPHIKVGRKFMVDPYDLREFIRRKKEAA